jgi:hypothetical protein
MIVFSIFSIVSINLTTFNRMLKGALTVEETTFVVYKALDLFCVFPRVVETSYHDKALSMAVAANSHFRPSNVIHS